MHTRALVLFSGGQDSTTCLADALTRFEHVETIGFDYGQRHHVELAQRTVVLREMRSRFADWAARLGDDHLIDVGVLGQISETSLTRELAFEMQASGLPNTFVPGRNLVFLTLAGALAYRRGLDTLVTGVCETDYSGYPDCRDDTMKASGHGPAPADRHAADVARQGANLATGACTGPAGRCARRRRCAGRFDRRAHAHLLRRRPQPPPRLGLRLRRLPRVPAARAGLGALAAIARGAVIRLKSRCLGGALCWPF